MSGNNRGNVSASTLVVAAREFCLHIYIAVVAVRNTNIVAFAAGDNLRALLVRGSSVYSSSVRRVAAYQKLVGLPRDRRPSLR